jgi:hypothetical protein
MNSRARLLLGLAGALAIARFVLVPWLGAQTGMHERLYAVTRQLDRAEAIVEAGPDLQARRDSLARTVADLLARAPQAASGSEHRVQVQRQLRTAVESAGLKVQLFEWVFDGESAPTGLAFGRVRMQLEGTLREVAEAHVTIEAGLPHVFVRSVAVNVRTRGNRGSAAGATVELDLYYQPGEAS